MRHIWKFAKAIIPLAPCLLYKSLNASQEISNEQIQTTIDKIFLTSQHSDFSDLKIFAFDAQVLGREICAHLDTTLGRHISTRFNDGQIGLQLLDSVRGHKNKDINDGVMQLILAVSCMKKSGAQSVTAIIPYFPYSSSPQIKQGTDFFTCFSADIVKLLQQSGCDQIITLNSPLAHPKGFARSSSFVNIDAPEIVVPYLMHKQMSDKPVLVGTDSNKIYLRNIHKLKKAFSIFDYNCDMGFFNQDVYIGQNVKDRDVILFNNIIRTGKSLQVHSKSLKKMGARNIYCFGFHGLCSNDLFEKLIEQLPIKQLIMTNSIFHANQNKKIRTISLAKFLAEIITIISDQKSLKDYRIQREMLNYAYLQKMKVLIKNKKEEAKFNNPDTRQYPSEQQYNPVNDLH